MSAAKTEIQIAIGTLRPDDPIEVLRVKVTEAVKQLSTGNRKAWKEEILLSRDWTAYPQEIQSLIYPPKKSMESEVMEEITLARSIFEAVLHKAPVKKEVLWHKIVDVMERICQPAMKIDRTAMFHYAGEQMKLTDNWFTTEAVAKSITPWLTHAPTIDNVKILGHTWDTDDWCYYRCGLVEDQNMDTPHWDIYLSRLSDHKAYLAWWYGVWSGLYKGRQLLWVKGNGQDGKTHTARALYEALFGGVEADGGVVVPISNAQLKASNKQFLFSYFMNAALAYYGDANNRYILFDELIKMISEGAKGDSVPLEVKGQQSYGGSLEARMAVNSNYHPAVSKDRFILSRLLYVELAPMDAEPDPDIIPKFKAEIPGLLYKARLAFEEVCGADGEIKQTPEMLAAIDTFAEEHYEKYTNLIDKKFVITGCEEDYIYGSEFQDICKREGMKGHDYTNLGEWLVKYMGVSKQVGSQNKDGRVRWVGIHKVGSLSKGKKKVDDTEDEDDTFT